MVIWHTAQAALSLSKIRKSFHHILKLFISFCSSNSIGSEIYHFKNTSAVEQMTSVNIKIGEQ